MKLLNHITNLIYSPYTRGFRGAFCLILTVFLFSCNAINEELLPCAPAPKSYTEINFVYDYNMYNEDLFYDHVGSVKLYVFDEDGYYIDDEEKHKEFFAPGEDFTMYLDQERLEPGKTYQFVAVAQGNTIGYDGSDEYQWFKVVEPWKKYESKIENYVLRLDRDTNKDGFAEVGIINYKDQYGQTQQMIDTLWTTKPDQVQIQTITKRPYKPSVEQQSDFVSDTIVIPMMRITNAVKVNVLGPIINANTDKDDYHVVIYFPNGNGYVDFCGDISQSTHPLYYQSLVKQVAPYSNNKEVRTRGEAPSALPYAYEGLGTRDDNNIAYALQARFGVSRLIAGDESMLQLYTKDDIKNPIQEIPFTEYLTKYLNDSGYDNQEFLDREFNFEVNMVLDEKGNLQYIQLTCDILPWARRVYFYDL